MHSEIHPNDLRGVDDKGVDAGAREMPAIIRATTQLDNSIDDLQNEVRRFIEAITPVMTPVNEKEGPRPDAGEMPGGQSDLANWLRQKSGQLTALNEAVRFARDRVEL